MSSSQPKTARNEAIWIVALALAVWPTLLAQPRSRLTLELSDYAQMPITAQPNGQNTMAQLARVNFLRDEPGGRRFFVNDLNGPLYILDKKTKSFTTYLDFNGAGGRPGLFRKLTFERNFATGLSEPAGMAFDASGNLFVAEFAGNAITKIAPDGTKTNFVTTLSFPAGLAFDTAGNLFVANSGAGAIAGHKACDNTARLVPMGGKGRSNVVTNTDS
jgi:hypothetical protein